MSRRRPKVGAAGGGTGSGGGGPDLSGVPFVTTATDASVTGETVISAIILAPGLDASKPLANAVAAGGLYPATDTNILYRTTGLSWVQAIQGDVSDAELTALASVVSAANTFPYFTGSGTAAVTGLSALARTILARATSALMRGDLGLGTMATLAALSRAAVKTANYTAVAGDIVGGDTTSGGFTVTLPTAPADGTLVAVKHIVQGGTNVLTVACAGSDVFNRTGGGTTLSLSLSSQAAVMAYGATAAVWTIIADDIPLSQLDLRFAPLAHTQAASTITDFSDAAQYEATMSAWVHGS